MPTITPASAPVPYSRHGAGSYYWRFEDDPSVPGGSIDVYDRPKWRQVEGTRGVYDWSLVDAAIARAAARGGLAIIGLVRNQINNGDDAYPTWYGPVTNWNDETFVAAQVRLIEAAGARYDGKILAVEMRNLGLFGEDHSHNATMATRERLVSAFLRSFPTTPFVHMTDNRPGVRWVQTLTHAPGIWLRRDSVGGINEALTNNLFLDPWNDGDIPFSAWERHCIIAELAGDLAPRDGNANWTARAGANPRSVGTSLLGNGNYHDVPTSNREEVAESMRGLGAAIRVVSASMPDTITAGALLTARVVFTNPNPGRLYEPWNAVLELSRSGSPTQTITLGSVGELRCPLSGTPPQHTREYQVLVPASLGQGVWTARLFVESPRRRQRYRLANADLTDNSLLWGEVTVGAGSDGGEVGAAPVVISASGLGDPVKLGGTRYVFRASQQYNPLYELPGDTLLTTGPYTAWELSQATDIAIQVAGGSAAQSVRALIYADDGTASSDRGRVRGQVNGAPAGLVGAAGPTGTIPVGSAMQERRFALPNVTWDATKLYWASLWLGPAPATRARALRQHQSSKAIITASATFSATGAAPATFPSGRSTQVTTELSLWVAGRYAGLAAPTVQALAGLRPGELRLAWTAGDTRLTHYRLDRSLDGVTWQRVALSRQRSFTDTGLSSAVSYQYRVAGIVGNQEVLSAVVTAAPAAGTARPMADLAPTMLPDTAILANPLRGLFCDTGTGTNVTPSATISDVPISEVERRQRLVDWAVWEPQQGVYKRDAMDAWLSAVSSTSAKRRGSFRITRLVVPGQSPSVLPTWLQKAPYAAFNDTDWVPVWDQGDLVRWSEALYARIGSWYNGDVRVARVDVGWYNKYGEWTGSYGGASSATLRRILDAALAAFPAKLISVNFPPSDREDVLLYYISRRERLGLRQDALADTKTLYMWSQYEGTRSDRARRWLDNPRHYRQAELIDWPQIVGADLGDIPWDLARYDVEMLGIQCVSDVNFDGSLSTYAAGVVRRMIAQAGYRLATPAARVPTTIALSQPAPVQLTWRNSGTGCTVEPWTVVWQLRNGAGAVVWSQESTLNLADIVPRSYKGFAIAPDVTHEDSLIVTGIATGSYTLGIQIPPLNDYTPAMSLYQEGASGTGAARWYPLRSVSIVANTGGGTTPQPPAQPINLTAVAGSQIRVTLAWEPVDDATSLTLERSLTGTGGWTTVATLSGTAIAAADTGLSPATTYYYRLIAANGAGNSLPSSTASVTTLSAGGGTWNIVGNVPASTGAASLAALTFARPSDVQAGDVLLVILGHRTAGNTLATPAGWTVVPSFPYAWTTPSPTLRLHALTRIATASEPASYTFTLSNATKQNARLLVLRGADPAAPVLVGEATPAGAGTALTETIDLGTQAGALLVWAALVPFDAGVTPPGAMIPLPLVSNDDPAEGCGLSVATEIAATTGSVTRAGTMTGATSNRITALIALKPVAGAGVPTEPITITITATTPSEATSTISLTWANTDAAATGISVERRVAGTEAWTGLVILGPTATSYTDSGSPVTAYEYRVAALNANGRSPYLTATVTTPAPPLPGAPASLTATATFWDSVELAWPDLVTGELAWQIERREGSGPWTVLQDDLAANTTTYTDTSVAPQATYTYRVAAVSAYGLGAYATSLAVTTPANTSPWKWVDAIRPLPDRIGVLQVIAENAMGYVMLTEDSVRQRYYSGPLVEGKLQYVGEGAAGLAAAQANAIVLPTLAQAVQFADGSFGGRLELTDVRRALVCRLAIKRINSARPAALAEWYARTLAVADDALFGSIRSIHIQAGAIEVDKHLRAGTISSTFWIASDGTSWRSGEGFFLGYLPEDDPARDAFARFRIGAAPGQGPGLRFDYAGGAAQLILEDATLRAPRITTAQSGARIEIDSGGIQGIDSTNTVQWAATTASNSRITFGRGRGRIDADGIALTTLPAATGNTGAYQFIDQSGLVRGLIRQIDSPSTGIYSLDIINQPAAGRLSSAQLLALVPSGGSATSAVVAQTQFGTASVGASADASGTRVRVEADTLFSEGNLHLHAGPGALGKYLELSYFTTAAPPPAPDPLRARLFLRYDLGGTGALQLCVRWQTGAVSVLATM